MRTRSSCAQISTALVFFVIGAGMFVGGAVFGWSSYQSLVGKERTEATVVNVETTEGVDNDVEYFPTVEFTTADGQFIQSTPAVVRETTALGGLVTVDNSDDGYETVYRVGDTVEVFYDPADPSKVVLNDFNKLWVGPLVVGGLGITFAGVGGLLVLIAIVQWWRRHSSTTGQTP